MTVFKPSIRGGFSDRNGIRKISTVIQKNNLDERTRNGIVNIIDKTFDFIGNDVDCRLLYEHIYFNIFNVTKDEKPYYNYECREQIVDYIKNEWFYDEIFSFLESFCKFCFNSLHIKSIYEEFNKFFERECVGYRFVDGLIIDIIDDIEIKELEDALDSKFSSSKKCIIKAMNLLYDRGNPDYANSVKESISAIESMCNIMLGTNNKTLGDALKGLDKKGIKIHSALKSAFSSLYGYTSDESGIRHNTGIDEKTTFEEAKFMLVACSAFLNYLTQIYEK